jgi:hypothetical protein
MVELVVATFAFRVTEGVIGLFVAVIGLFVVAVQCYTADRRVRKNVQDRLAGARRNVSTFKRKLERGAAEAPASQRNLIRERLQPIVASFDEYKASFTLLYKKQLILCSYGGRST